MKGVAAAEARARFSDLLDRAERGEPVVIERRGVRFLLMHQAVPPPGPAAPFFEWVDPAVAAGQWRWMATASGLRVRPKRARKTR